MATVGVGRIVRGTNTTDLAPNAAGAGGDQFPAGGDVWCYWANASVSPITVTVACPGNVRGQAIEDLVVTVPASGFAAQGPFPGDTFGDDAGLVSMTYSTETDLTFGAWKLGQ